MADSDDVALTEDQRLRARIHRLVDTVQEHGGQLREHRVLMEQLRVSAPEASRMRFSTSILFTILASALTIAGMLWKVSAGQETLALKIETNYRLLEERTNTLKEAIEEEKRQRTLQAYDLKTAIEQKGRRE